MELGGAQQQTDGHFSPGSALREVELAASLGVSRGSVREGLSKLEREGLINTAWHRGTRVIDVTLADVEEVYALRAALDRLASITARYGATEEQIDELDEMVDDMESALDSDAGNARLVALDMAFHDAVYLASGNGRLQQAWRAVRSQVHLFQLRRVGLGPDRYRSRVVAEHRELAGLIRGGDPEELGRVAEKHVHTARIALLVDLPL